MAHFNLNQLDALKSIIEDISYGGADEHKKLIEDHNLLEAFEKSDYIETIKDDIYNIIDADESFDAEIPDSIVETLALELAGKIDHSEQNNFIRDYIIEHEGRIEEAIREN